MESARTLHAALRRHRVVRLEVTENLGSSPFGIPVALSEELVVVHFLRDFRLDGYAAVPLARVTAVHAGPFERTHTRLCAAEGTLAKLGAPPRIDTTTLLGLLSDLRRTGKYVILNRADGDTNAFTLGPITGVTDDTVSTRHFDATGSWSRTPAQISLGDLLDIQWGSRYIRVWQRHNPMP